jgi:hypothetical protein
MIRYQTENGRLKYSSKSEAEKTARKLGLDGTHSHMMQINGQQKRIYMPGNNHQNLNDALRARGREPTMVPGQGGGMMSSGGMGMMGGMMGGGSMMNSGSSSSRSESDEGGMLLPDADELKRMNESADQTDESLPSFMGDGRADADGEFFSDGALTGDDAATTAEPEPDLVRDEDVREPFDSMFGSGDPDDDDEMELY